VTDPLRHKSGYRIKIPIIRYIKDKPISDTSVVDLYWFPLRIRNQDFDEQKLGKYLIKFFFKQKYNLLIPRPPLRKSKLQEKSSFLKTEHPALEISNYFTFLGSFLPS
jgi:hypothetical protein